MWEELIKLAVSNGIWAVLFVGLLIYQIRDSSSREIKYQNTIASLTDKLTIVEEIRGDIVDIKDCLETYELKSKQSTKPKTTKKVANKD